MRKQSGSRAYTGGSAERHLAARSLLKLVSGMEVWEWIREICEAKFTTKISAYYYYMLRD